MLAAVLALCPVGAARAGEAACEGDCDGDRAVTVSELITGVRIVLGEVALGECAPFDRDGSGDVAIDELIAAVTRALQGCAGAIDEPALRAAARASVEPLFRVLDLGSATFGGSVGSIGGLAGETSARRATGGTAGFGCEFFECFLFGEFTGSEEVCCGGGELRLTADGCVFDDGFGTIVARDGVFSLQSDDPLVCSGVVTAGSSFAARYDAFFLEVADATGDLITIRSLSETFTASARGCGAGDDALGLGARGDGLREISGSARVVATDPFGTLLADASSVADLRLDVASRSDSGACVVAAELDGALESSDFAAGLTVDSTFDGFAITQNRRGDTLDLSLDGTLATDCLGAVALRTISPLRFEAGNDCLTRGRLEARVGDGVVAVTFTPNGGLELDFGNDGSVDERAARCTDLAVDQCVAASTPGACERCSGSCDADLVCAPCAFACTGQVQRCASADDFVACEDGLF
jgi:hypothetical protein